MITVKDFAMQYGCGESIVYRHIRNHREALGDRIQKAHGKTWLTDEGVEYIRSLMTQAPIVVAETSEVVTALYQQLNDLHVAFETAQAEIIALTKEKGELTAKVAKIDLLEADNEAQRVKIAKAEQKALDANSEAHRAKQELQAEMEYVLALEAYRDLSWFQRLRTPKPMRKDKE